MHDFKFRRCLSPIHHQKNEKTSLYPYDKIDCAKKPFTHWVKETMRKQRGKKIMSQKTLPFKYEEDKKDRGVTSLGGLPLYLDLAHTIGLFRSVREHMQIREDGQGWTDSQVIMSLILLNLAGGKLPSGSFGENAAWWWCMILAFNLNSLMKNLVLRGEWKNKRMKAIRYWIINIPARIIKHSRELIIQLRRGHPSFRLIKDARARIMEMGCVPAG